MKFTVICLVACCFVSLNGQYYRPGRQNQQYYMQSPKALFYPGFGYIFPSYMQPFSYTFNDDHQNNQENIDLALEDDESNNSNGQQREEYLQSRARLQPIRQQGKFGFYGASLFNANLLSAFSSLNLVTMTSTVLSTTTSTVTIASIKSCIGTSQFIAGSTNTCSRKRRGFNVDEIEAIEAIEPTRVEPLEATAAPLLLRDRRGAEDEQPEIVSSQEEKSSGHRQKRAVIVTITSTITAYSFSTTSVTKSFTLVETAAQSLSCLPSGYTVC